MNKRKNFKSIIWMLTVAIFALSACGPSAESVAATQTQSVVAIFTAAAQTIEAEAAKATATPQPTQTPVPSPTPTVTATPTMAITTTPTTSAAQNFCDNSVFVSDVSIPDNTRMTPGQVFEKTWELKNTGSCTWTESYTISFVSGEVMNGSARSIAQSVAPQQQANITVRLTAPTTAGTYTGYWRLANAKGAQFGQIVSVVIVVGSDTGTTATATSTVTATPSVYP